MRIDGTSRSKQLIAFLGNKRRLREQTAALPPGCHMSAGNYAKCTSVGGCCQGAGCIFGTCTTPKPVRRQQPRQSYNHQDSYVDKAGFMHPTGDATTNPLLALLKAGGFKLGIDNPAADRMKKLLANRPSNCHMSGALFKRCVQVGGTCHGTNCAFG